MIVHIYRDERYPDYGVDTQPHPSYPVVDVSQELLAEIRAVEATYSAMQTKLRELAEQQKVHAA